MDEAEKNQRMRALLDEMPIASLPPPKVTDGLARLFGRAEFTAAQMLAAVVKERERCAAICDEMVLYTGYDCAAAIRQGQ